MNDFLTNIINRHMNMTETVQPRARSRFEPENREYLLTGNTPQNSANISYETASRAKTPVENNEYHSEAQPESREVQLESRADKKKYFIEKNGMVEDRQRESIDQDEVKEENDKPVHERERGVPVDLTNPEPVKEKIQPGAAKKKKTGMDNNIRKVDQFRVTGVNTVFGSSENYNESGTAADNDLPPLQKDESRQKLSGEPGGVFPEKPTGRRKLKRSNFSEVTDIIRQDRTGTQNSESGSRGLLEVPARLEQQQKGLPGAPLFKDSVAKAEPAINVTIGRIDVRAAVSPAPERSRKKKKPSGVMSLDTYLGKSAGGGRR